jgi:hypothetical protein
MAACTIIASVTPGLGYFHPRGSVRVSIAVAAAAATAAAAASAVAAGGCCRSSASKAGWVRRSEISQHVVEVIIGFIAHHVSFLVLALAVTFIILSTLLVLLRHSEQNEQGWKKAQYGQRLEEHLTLAIMQ